MVARLSATAARLPVPVVIAVVDQLITPIIPPSTRHRRHTTGRPVRPLPLADPPTPATPDGVVYGMSRLDTSGRITDHAITTALGWHPGHRLTLTTHAHLLELATDPTGLTTTTGRGHIPLPAAARRRLGLHPGDRVLLTAHPGIGHLLIYPITTVHHALSALDLGGDLA